MKGRTIGVVTLMAMASFGSTAFAKPEKAPRADKADDADWMVAAGLTLYRSQQYLQARDMFLRAYAIDARSGTLLNLALAELQSGQPLEALRHLRTFIGAPDAPADKVEQATTKLIPRALSQTAHVTVTAPAEWSVAMDDVLVGRAPLDAPIDIMPGTHTASAQKDGEGMGRKFDAAPGATLSIELTPPEPVPVVARTVPLTELTEVPAPRPDGRRGSSTAKTVTVVGLAAGALAAAGVALYFAVDIASESDRIEQARGDIFGAGPRNVTACQQPSTACRRLSDAIDARTHDYNLRNGFAITAEVFGLGALATTILWPSPKPIAPSAWLRPTLGGVELGGRF